MATNNMVPFSGFFNDVMFEGMPPEQAFGMTIPEIQMNESLLSASLETVLIMQADIHHVPKRNYDLLKGQNVSFYIENPNLPGISLDVRQTIYR
ncbi:MAG: hypothetical protein WD512_04120, partial [Candidatus Paceibacterota bacterium]